MSKNTQTFGKMVSEFNSFLNSHKKTAAEMQGDCEKKESFLPSDKEVKDMLPAGGNPASAPVSNETDRGVAVNEKLPGQKAPATEEKVVAQASPSTKVDKVASNDKIAAMANSVMSKLINAQAQFKKSASEVRMPAGVTAEISGASVEPAKAAPAAQGTSEVKVDASKVESAKEEKKEEKEEKEETEEEKKEAGLKFSDEQLSALAQKVAQVNQDIEAGYNLGKVLFGKMASAAASAAASEDNSTLSKIASVLANEGIARPHIETIVKAAEAALPELVGNIAAELNLDEVCMQKAAELQAAGATEAQIEEFFVKAGEYDRAALEHANMEEAINAKVAELKAAGLTDEQVEFTLKKIAADAQGEQLNQACINKAAELLAAGATAEQVEEFFRQAGAADGQAFAKSAAVAAPVKQEAAPAASVAAAPKQESNDKVAAFEKDFNAYVGSLKTDGYTDAQINAHLNATTKIHGMMKSAGFSEDSIVNLFSRLNSKTAKVNAKMRINKIASEHAKNPQRMALELKKLAEADPAAEQAMMEAMGGGAPAEAAPMDVPAAMEGGAAQNPQAALEQIIAGLDQLIQEGTITEEEALSILQELGVVPGAGAEAAPIDPAAEAAGPVAA